MVYSAHTGTGGLILTKGSLHHRMNRLRVWVQQRKTPTPSVSAPYFMALAHVQRGYLQTTRARLGIVGVILLTGSFLLYTGATSTSLLAAFLLLLGLFLVVQVIVALSDPTGSHHVQRCITYFREQPEVYDAAALHQIKAMAAADVGGLQVSANLPNAILTLAITLVVAQHVFPDSWITLGVMLVLLLLSSYFSSIDRANANVVLQQAATLRLEAVVIETERRITRRKLHAMDQRGPASAQVMRYILRWLLRSHRR